MTAIDLYNTLTPKERTELLKLLRQSEPTACQRTGHKFKVISTTKGGLFSKAVSKCLCTQCGETISR